MPASRSNAFLWNGETVFIPLETIKKITRQFAKNLNVLDDRLAAAETDREDLTAMEVLEPLGERLAFLMACLTGRIYRNNGKFFVATDGKQSIVVAPSSRKKGYFIADVKPEVPQSGMPVEGFPRIAYDVHLPKRVKDFVGGFFSDGMQKLTNPIDAQLLEEHTLEQIMVATQHKRYFVFGYLMRRLMYEKAVKYRRNGAGFLWRRV